MSSGKFIYKGQHRKFQYVPRYYYAQQEALDNRRNEIKAELGIDQRKYSSKVGPGMFSSSRSKTKEKLTSVVGTRFLSIIILLCSPVAWIFYGEVALWVCGIILAIPTLIQVKSFLK